LVHTVFKNKDFLTCWKLCPLETETLVIYSPKSANKYTSALGAEADIIQCHNLKKQIKKHAPYEIVLTRDAFLICQRPNLTYFSAASLFNHAKLPTQQIHFNLTEQM
jgi:hypothetical protein